VFASLLDAEHGGFYRIAPDRADYVSRQLYLPDTAILVTRFMTPDGVGEVHDFMPVVGGAVTDRHRLVRNIRVVRGVMRFAIEIQPRFDYGRAPHKVDVTEHGVVFASDGLELTVHGIAPEGSSLAEGISLERAGDGLRWTRTLREGQSGGVVLESMCGPARRVTPEQVQQLQDETARFWRSWLHRSNYTGRWREMVNRSAITLKLLTYAPTGAPVAAPTMGLPEQAGGERNWDYRYTWIRDGSFSIYALLGPGRRGKRSSQAPSIALSGTGSGSRSRRAAWATTASRQTSLPESSGRTRWSASSRTTKRARCGARSTGTGGSATPTTSRRCRRHGRRCRRGNARAYPRSGWLPAC
jgi:GH15 family glucan-1,4-alpha-glucosidase